MPIDEFEFKSLSPLWEIARAQSEAQLATCPRVRANGTHIWIAITQPDAAGLRCFGLYLGARGASNCDREPAYFSWAENEAEVFQFIASGTGCLAGADATEQQAVRDAIAAAWNNVVAEELTISDACAEAQHAAQAAVAEKISADIERELFGAVDRLPPEPLDNMAEQFRKLLREAPRGMMPVLASAPAALTAEEFERIVGGTFVPGSVVWVKLGNVSNVIRAEVAQQLREEKERLGLAVEFIVTNGDDIDVRSAPGALAGELEIFEVLRRAQRAACIQDGVAMLREAFLILKREA